MAANDEHGKPVGQYRTPLQLTLNVADQDSCQRFFKGDGAVMFRGTEASPLFTLSWAFGTFILRDAGDYPLVIASDFPDMLSIIDKRFGRDVGSSLTDSLSILYRVQVIEERLN